MWLLQYIRELIKPDQEWILKTPEQFRRQREIQALWIGILAFSMPAFLYYSARNGVGFRDTISHFYYAPFLGDFFIIVTTCIGLLLLFYRGQSFFERCLAVAAGICAILVAFVPTTTSGLEVSELPSRIFAFQLPMQAGELPENSFLEKRPEFALIHGAMAAGLFSILAFFSLFVFTALDNDNELQSAPGNKNKLIRNWIYKISGCVIAICVLALAANKIWDLEGGGNFPIWDRKNLTFHFEWLALASFGISWIVKGRAGGFMLRDDKPNQIFALPDKIIGASNIWKK